MKSIKSILLIEDNLGDARLLREMFSEQDSQEGLLTHVTSMGEAEKHLAQHKVDIVLLDLGLSDAQGLGAVRRARAAAPDAALVVLTGLDDDSLASEAMQEGAQDYLVKCQVEVGALLRALRYSVERKRLAQVQDDFVATVSHELRTPLTSISGSLGLLAGKAAGNLPATAARLIAIAHTNSQRLVRLVNDILDIEKVESGQVTFNLKRVEVRALVEQAMEANREFSKGYEVQLRLDESSPREVRADPDRLMQVVTNLLSNAIKFSPPNSEVVVTVEDAKENVRITVRDHGPGIPEGFKSRIFEKFAQADTSNQRQKGGTGLGLSIVKQIVRRLGGEVGFNDAPGGGTIFFVELPSLGLADEIETPRLEEFSAARPMRRKGDVDATTAIDISRTPAGALVRSTAKDRSAILVALLLPEGDGTNLIHQLRARPQYADTPIVVVSANAGRRLDDPQAPEFNVLNWLNESLTDRRRSHAVRPSLAHDGGARLRVLHIDDDPDVLGIVALALNGDAQVVSVATLAEARRALATSDFDLAIIDLALDGSSGLDLLPELHDGTGEAIPAITYSAQPPTQNGGACVQATLPKSRASIESLITILRKRVTVPVLHALENRESV